ncbi:hypothetical protein FFM54_15445 [Burkholderia pseudomallei]|nr:hypothetical protein FFM54_15445 [Burkholderia pseudomallei]
MRSGSPSVRSERLSCFHLIRRRRRRRACRGGCARSRGRSDTRRADGPFKTPASEPAAARRRHGRAAPRERRPPAIRPSVIRTVLWYRKLRIRQARPRRVRPRHAGAGPTGGKGGNRR